MLSLEYTYTSHHIIHSYTYTLDNYHNEGFVYNSDNHNKEEEENDFIKHLQTYLPTMVLIVSWPKAP